MLNRFKTLESDFHKVHNSKYTYNKFVYSGSHHKSTITCPIHGDFEQNTTNHLQGNGCPECGRKERGIARIKKLGQDFIKKAKKVHGSKYDYSETIYSGTANKCTFICHLHNKFEQLPQSHLKGHGCPQCGNISIGEKLSSEHRKTFITKASKIHNNFYDYKDFIYINNETKGAIVCPLHGKFKQEPKHHINRKAGCHKCAVISMAKKQSAEAKKMFKARATKKHNNTYDYSKFTYIKSGVKSIIICSKHGEFKQTPEMHLSGRGCPRCKAKRDNDAIYIWQATREFYNDKPVYKIGITSSRLGNARILQVIDKLNWEYKIILLENVICEASDLEKELHLLGTNPKWTGFDGATEFRAFNEDELKQAIDIVRPYII